MVCSKIRNINILRHNSKTMVNFGKIVNGQFERAKTHIVLENGGWISMPTDEMYIANGYKPLVLSEQPSIEENQYLTENYVEYEDYIQINYTVNEI